MLTWPALCAADNAVAAEIAKVRKNALKVATVLTPRRPAAPHL